MLQVILRDQIPVHPDKLYCTVRNKYIFTRSLFEIHGQKVGTDLGIFFRMAWFLALSVLFTWLFTVLAALDAA